MVQDFCSYSRRGNRRIAGYVSVSTTLTEDGQIDKSESTSYKIPIP